MNTNTAHEPHSQSQNSTPPSSSSSSSATRLWRPAAQRNLRNQWSELNYLRQEWRSVSSSARSHATAIVNSYLSQTYMDGMDFGVLNDMPNIRKKACSKLLKQQELYRDKLLSSYSAMEKDIVPLACLLIAAKLEETRYIYIELYIVEVVLLARADSFNLAKLYLVELDVLENLKWKLHMVTPFHYLGYLIQKLDCPNLYRGIMYDASDLIVETALAIAVILIYRDLEVTEVPEDFFGVLDEVAVVTRMVNSCKSLRCYNRGTSSSELAKFSFFSEDNGDSGDCGGIPVYTFFSVSSFEELAWEMVQMFKSELKMKRLIVMELLSIYDKKVAKVNELNWSDEFYDGEFNELRILNLNSEETRQPILPCLRNCKSSTSILKSRQQHDSNVLQVYITTWLVEVNIDRYRMDEIFAIVGGEMRVDFS